jgi:hypothetical protein
MAFTNFNPPFTNQNVQDFFDFRCENQFKAIFLQEWIGGTFPDLYSKLAYHVPFYFLAGVTSKYYGEKIFYLHYVELNGVLELEISFVRGAEIRDTHNLFQEKNKQTKAILITSIDEDFMQIIASYIRQAMDLK